MTIEYRRDRRGFLVRVSPKTFRRGRISWSGGRSTTANEPTGGKKKLSAPRSRWVGAKATVSKRVKLHQKA